MAENDNNQNPSGSAQAPNPEATPGQATPEDMSVEFLGRKFDLGTKEGRADHKAFMEGFGRAHGQQANELGGLRKLKKTLDAVDHDQEFQGTLEKLFNEGNHKQAADLIATRDRKQRAVVQGERENDAFWQDFWDANEQVVAGARDVGLKPTALRKLAEVELGEKLFEETNQVALLTGFFQKFRKTQAAAGEPPAVPVVQSRGRASGGTTAAAVSAGGAVSTPADDDYYKILKDNAAKRR